MTNQRGRGHSHLMYKIIGADQKEYGPITADQLRQWISEGRVNGQTRVLPEGATAWKTVSELPEFASVLPAAIPPPVTMTRPPAGLAPAMPAPSAQKTNGTAVWALITGIIAFLPCCWGIAGVVSLVLGCVALSQLKKNPQQEGSGFAIAGIVLGILSILMALVAGILLASFPQYFQDFPNSFNK